MMKLRKTHPRLFTGTVSQLGKLYPHWSTTRSKRNTLVASLKMTSLCTVGLMTFLALLHPPLPCPGMTTKIGIELELLW